MKRTRLHLCALLTLALGAASSGHAQLVNGMVPANTPINNQAFMEGTQGDSGEAYQAQSNVVTVTVTAVGGVRVSIGGEDTTTPGDPGDTVEVGAGDTGQLAFTVTNTGNGNDTFTITLAQDSGRPLDSMTFWVDTDGDGTVDSNEVRVSGDTITLTAGQQQTVVFLGQLPGDSVSTDLYVVQLTAQGATSPAVADTENYGAFDTQDVLGARIDIDTSQTIRPGQVLNVSKSLVNSGNVSADTSNLSFTTSENDPKEIVSYSYRFGSATGAQTLQQAWENSVLTDGPLAPFTSRPLTITATAISATATMTPFDTYSVTQTVNLIPDANDQTRATDSDVSTFTPAIFSGTPFKRQALCVNIGSGFNCGPLQETPVTPKPCDVLIYSLRVAADPTSGSALRRPVIRDQISSLLNPLYARSYRAVNDNAMNTGAYQSGLVSSDNAAWSTTINTFSTDTIWAGYDSNADGTMTSSDMMIGGNVLELEIATQVKGDSCAVFNRATATNYPALPSQNTSTVSAD